MTLPLGLIVRHTDGTRGVVVFSAGRGIWRGYGPMLTDADAVVEQQPGLYRITNMDDGWTPVPVEDETGPERVLATAASWERPGWLRADETPEEMDSYPAALLGALLTGPEHAAVFSDFHYPTSLTELARAVAVAVANRDLKGNSAK